MRGRYAIALLVLVGLLPAAWGQMRGGGPPGGGHGGGGRGGGHGAPPASGSRSGFHPGSHPGFHPGGHNGFRPGFHPGFRSHRFNGFVPFAPFYYVPYYDYNAAQQADYEAQQAEARARADAEEDARKDRQMQRTLEFLRNYDEQRSRDLEQERLARLAAPPQPELPPDPPTILIFKDGRRMEIHNYAIAGATLYALEGARSQEISLPDLDLPATIKLNHENGTDLHLPGKR